MKCALWLDMGLGKTLTALTAFDELKLKKCLVIAPLKVANTVWDAEIEKWKHLSHLTCSIVTGSEKERLDALAQNVMIYIINHDNIPWLKKQRKTKCNMIIIDEATSFKNPSSKRFKALMEFRADYIVELTGTPAPNGYIDLWSQIALLDRGFRLGKNIAQYQKMYFTKGYMDHKYTPKDPQKIFDKLADICMSMSAKDYLDMPEKIHVETCVNLDTKTQVKYKELEKEFVLKLEDDTISAVNKAVLVNKLLQFCNGALYTEDGKWVEVHTEKLERLEGLLEDYPNDNVIVAYNFKSDLERLQKKFSHAVKLDSKGSQVKDWNAGKIKLLLCQPASSSEGLNLQQGGNIIVWFSLTWNLKDYLQFNARLHRQGQLKPVIINHLLVKNSMDTRVLKLLLEEKTVTQTRLLESLKHEK